MIIRGCAAVVRLEGRSADAFYRKKISETTFIRVPAGPGPTEPFLDRSGMGTYTDFITADFPLTGGQRMKRLVLVVLFLQIACFASAQETRFTIPLDSSPSLGPADAPVTIVEFIDFQ